jgi:hypothetical protein
MLRSYIVMLYVDLKCLLTGTNLNVFSLLEMLYSCIVMFVRFFNMNLCYMWIRNAYMLYVNRSLCYMLYSYVRLYDYARLYADVMIKIQCLYYISICLCYDSFMLW